MSNQKGKVFILSNLVVILAVMLALWPAGQSFGSGDNSNGPRKGGCEFPGMEMIFSRLDLSVAQKRDIALILKAHREEASALFSNLITTRKNLFNAVHAPEYTEAYVRQAAHEAAVWEIDLTVLRAQVISEIRNVLTPEQKDEVAERQAQYGDKIQDRVEECFQRLDTWVETHAAIAAK
ncbi:MAG: Spy/CpxP family protein refolding chaperone [Syntrophobacter sp.]